MSHWPRVGNELKRSKDVNADDLNHLLMMIQITFKALVSVMMMRKMRKIEITFKALVTVMMMRKMTN